MRAAIALVMRVVAARKAGRQPALEDMMVMADALTAAVYDGERRPIDHHLGLFGAWRGEIIKARQLEVCREFEFAKGETMLDAAGRLRRQAIHDRHRGADHQLLGAGGEVPSIDVVLKRLKIQ
jgi:hypothetical protein